MRELMSHSAGFTYGLFGSSPVDLLYQREQPLDAGGTLIASDTFTGTLAGFAHSTLNTPIGPGAHRIVVTGTGTRDASMGIALSVVDDDGIFTSSFEG